MESTRKCIKDDILFMFLACMQKKKPNQKNNPPTLKKHYSSYKVNQLACGLSVLEH